MSECLNISQCHCSTPQDAALPIMLDYWLERRCKIHSPGVIGTSIHLVWLASRGEEMKEPCVRRLDVLVLR